MTHDPSAFLRHILMCLDRVLSYTEEGREAFFHDTRTQDAVVRNLEIIGQAVKDFGVVELAAKAPTLPWNHISGMRNVLAHQYLGVDLSLVWNVVERDLPELRKAVIDFLDETSHDTD